MPRSKSPREIQTPCREFQHRRLTWPAPVLGMSSGVEQLVDFHQGHRCSRADISTQVSLLATSRYQPTHGIWPLSQIHQEGPSTHCVAVGNAGTHESPTTATYQGLRYDDVCLLLHIPVENEHLFRFKMNADSGLRVHRFRTPQCTYSDVR